MTAPEWGHTMTEQTSHAADQSDAFEPVIVGFTCNWCSYRAADLAGTARVKYPPNVRLIRLMCSGRLDPTFVLKALAGGADGVLITGCHPGECHYLEQNYKAMRRYRLLRRILTQMGIEPERVRLVWASAAEGVRLAGEVASMVEEVRGLGPLNWGRRPKRRRLSWITIAVPESAETPATVEVGA
jgi:F420-non-reducing hydrogenase iron-sulfur subunit